MKRRKFLLGSGALVGAGGLVIDTTGFSTAQAEREVNVDVVGDEEALLQLIYPDEVEVTDCEEVILVTLGNLFGEEITIDDFWTEPDLALYPDPTGETLANGEKIDVKLDPSDLIDRGITQVSFGAKISGDGVSAETTTNRTVTYDIQFDINRVRFEGAGNVDISTTLDCPFELQYWVADEIENPANENGNNDGDSDNENSNNNGGNGNNESNENSNNNSDNGNSGLPPGKITEFEREQVANFNPRNKLQPSQPAGPGPGYVAIYIPLLDRSYYRNNFDLETNEVRWGTAHGVQVDGDLELEKE